MQEVEVWPNTDFLILHVIPAIGDKKSAGDEWPLGQ